MDFDLDMAKERSVKNPVYYIQYAYARVASIFRKTKITSQNPRLNLLQTQEEKGLIKKLIQFTEVIEDTANDYQIHRLTRYAHELAHAFHNFYEKQRVLTGDQELTRSRIALAGATRTILRSTLGLLGINAPDKM